MPVCSVFIEMNTSTLGRLLHGQSFKLISLLLQGDAQGHCHKAKFSKNQKINKFILTSLLARNLNIANLAQRHKKKIATQKDACKASDQKQKGSAIEYLHAREEHYLAEARLYNFAIQSTTC